MRRRREKLTCDYDSHPSFLGKVWHFLWHEDSWRSFFVDALLVVLIGNFILYPGVGLLMGTDYPAVAVVSGSMDHHSQSYGDWWDEHENQYAEYNITKSEFRDFAFNDGFNRGDVLIVVGDDNYDVGDVIVYSVSERSYPIIHRVIEDNYSTYSTKGDANSGQISFEKSISEDQVRGRAVFKIPLLGWPKVLLVELFN